MKLPATLHRLVDRRPVDAPADARRRDHDRTRGITLVELMVVISILGIMATVVALNVVPRLRESSVKLTQSEMRRIAEACELFEVSVGRLPESIDELSNPPEGFEPFLKDGDMQDAWGSDYEFNITEDGVQLISFGADKMEGGTGQNQDLVYPKEDE